MRVELLFLRWLLIIAVMAGGVIYLQTTRQTRPPPPYQTIPLIQGGKSSGMPLAGIVIEPNKRDIYAIVGGAESAKTGMDFFVLWKGENGETYGTTFTTGERSAWKLCEMSAEGRLRMLPLKDNKAGGGEMPHGFRIADTEATLRSVLNVLPGTLGSSAPR